MRVHKHFSSKIFGEHTIGANIYLLKNRTVKRKTFERFEDNGFELFINLKREKKKEFCY